ncbi:cAMP-binding domain of CRP or a regulatory subunit of cAMP-dependent protein kinases [Modicisalibacter ilicicola DSM 19980]|uniref:cAMP-binding domain of CRP or a regulatory subunit of cAMP-dependent protein kinases n=1 Tax=Modicisalibacter ilicicola DSM 19980 TaxID=1121942 RepID=A0A1M4UC16_9GAMM|nr:Crp/Fnr family transcriptional regulator [Halomonas ilicicola]SHE54113.1 cAMP-binding domain of CRP or a regulatory subunit of cAMP-dependent protein kinases [Halomonas ilicicola DSM 19980]
MDQQDSCIVRLFSNYCALSEKDKELLFALEQSPTEVRAGETLWKECDRASEFCTIRRGWAYSYRNLGDGSRQILEIYLPGDIIGMREFAFSQRLSGVTMIDDGVICYFPHRRLLDIFRSSTTLTAVLFAIASRHQVLLTERLVNLARRSAYQRLAHFLYEMYERLGQTDSLSDGHFRLPLSQEQLGDALGLSSVHISRTFSTFREEGLVLRERHRICLVDPLKLAAVAEFDSRYLNDSLRPLFSDIEFKERGGEVNEVRTE